MFRFSLGAHLLRAEQHEIVYSMWKWILRLSGIDERKAGIESAFKWFTDSIQNPVHFDFMLFFPEQRYWNPNRSDEILSNGSYTVDMKQWKIQCQVLKCNIKNLSNYQKPLLMYCTFSLSLTDTTRSRSFWIVELFRDVLIRYDSEPFNNTSLYIMIQNHFNKTPFQYGVNHINFSVWFRIISIWYNLVILWYDSFQLICVFSLFTLICFRVISLNQESFTESINFIQNSFNTWYDSDMFLYIKMIWFRSASIGHNSESFPESFPFGYDSKSLQYYTFQRNFNMMWLYDSK